MQSTVEYIKSKSVFGQILFLFILIIILGRDSIQSQEIKRERIIFYNVENLFDIKNDSLKNDDEFLPEGPKNWDNYRFYDKLNNI